MRILFSAIALALVGAALIGCGSSAPTEAETVNQAPAPKNADGMTTEAQGGSSSAEESTRG